MNIKKRKELINRELEIYRAEQKLVIDNELIELKMEGADDIANYEHTYHHGMEERRVELAKLEALKEVMENDVTTYKMLIKEKDAELARMHSIVIELSRNNGIKLVK